MSKLHRGDRCSEATGLRWWVRDPQKPLKRKKPSESYWEIGRFLLSSPKTLRMEHSPFLHHVNNDNIHLNKPSGFSIDIYWRRYSNLSFLSSSTPQNVCKLHISSPSCQSTIHILMDTTTIRYSLRYTKRKIPEKDYGSIYIFIHKLVNKIWTEVSGKDLKKNKRGNPETQGEWKNIHIQNYLEITPKISQVV